MPVPDFLVIGAAKSGTTSIHHWLGDHPNIYLPEKEIHFFTRQDRWDKGTTWYFDLFAPAPADALCGEVSPDYTALESAAVAAQRIFDVAPSAKLLYLVRHPLDRLRSHFEHHRLKSREARSLADALAAPSTDRLVQDYVGRSMYFSCLTPYIERFPREQLRVVRFEDLINDGATWDTVLRFLGREPRPRPAAAYNVSAERRQYTRVMGRLWDRGIRLQGHGFPKPIRRLGRAVLTRPPAARRSTPSESVPTSVAQTIWDDITQLEAWLGSGRLWER